jgi:ribonuclease P protein component
LRIAARCCPGSSRRSRVIRHVILQPEVLSGSVMLGGQRERMALWCGSLVCVQASGPCPWPLGGWALFDFGQQETVCVWVTSTMSRDQRFHQHEHLRLRSDFARVFAQKRSAGDNLLVTYVAENDLGCCRLGLVVSRKVGNAVERNYVRRRIREAFRTSRDRVPAGLDIICIARPNAKDCRYDIARSFSALVLKAFRRRAESRGDSKPQPDPGEVRR